MRAAKGRKIIVKSDLVGQVGDREAQTPTVTIAMEQIVIANGDIEQPAGINALRIVIVVFLSRCRHLKIDRAELICWTGSHGGSKRARRGTHAVAGEATLILLVGGQRQTGDGIVLKDKLSFTPVPVETVQVAVGARHGVAPERDRCHIAS